MSTIPVQVSTNCTLDECRDENNNVDVATVEHQYNWSNNSNNNNKIIAKGIVKLFLERRTLLRMVIVLR